MYNVLKCLLVSFFLSIGLVSWADDCIVDGIYYELDTIKKEACVKPCGDGRYQGQVLIPASILVEGVEYTVTSIGEKAFDNCNRLYSISIPNSVTSIRRGAFTFSGLVAVTIPASVTSLGEHAFEGCWSLTNVNLSEGLKSIGEWAFAHTGLFTVTIPNSVESIGEWAFSGCSDMHSMKVKKGNTHYDSHNDCNAIIETATNTLIAGCLNTIIPNSVRVIGPNAFWGCRMTSLTIPEGVTMLDRAALSCCYNLQTITLPKSVTTIGEFAFSSCESLTSIDLPEGITSIGNDAFMSCLNLSSIIIPKSVTSIDGMLFTGCRNLVSIIVRERNAHYDSRDNCNAIIETATNKLIASCKNTMMIPKSVRVIGNAAFDQCVDKTSITIPEGVTQIEDYAFNDCQGFRSVIIPDGVTSIGDAAFRGCRNLTSVSIPNSVTHIGESAFDCCVSLPSITLPKNLTTIGEGILYNCDMMEAVHCQGTIPPKVVINKSEGHANLSTWRFEKPKQTAKTILYVPKGAKDAYRSAEYWKNYEIVEE